MKVARIPLTNAQIKALAKVSKDTGMKQTEVLRRCVEEALKGTEIYPRRKAQ